MEPDVERRFERLEALLESNFQKSELRFQKAEARSEARSEKLEARFEKRMKGFEKLAEIGMKEIAHLRRMHRVTVRALCRRSCHANFRLVSQIPFGVWKGRLGMLACQWDRIHACIGKPSIPLEAERKNSIRKAPTKSVSGPSSRLILRG